MIGRRALLSGLAATALTAGAARAATPGRRQALWVISAHSGDEMAVPFRQDGSLMVEGYSRLCWLFRDWRQERMLPMDPRLFDLLWAVQSAIRFQRPLQLNSGYRTRETNEMLRRLSEGVAPNSFHIRGMAADVTIPGLSPAAVAEIAAGVCGDGGPAAGGIGLYPTFTHLDCGPHRRWGRP